MRDLHNNLDPKSSVRHSAQATAANGTGVNIAGAEGAEAVIDVIALGGTSPTATYVLQDSADDSTYANVPAADLLGAQPAAFSAAGLVKVGYVGIKKFLRWRLDALTGTTPTSTASGTIVKGLLRKAPAA